MNTTIQLRHILDYISPKVGAPVTVTLHGGGQLTGTLSLVTSPGDSAGYANVTLLHLATTGGVVHQIDPVYVVAVGV